MNESENAKAKAKFRNSKAWKVFKEEIKKDQKNKDFLSGNRLTKTAACHHMDLNEAHYSDISDKTHFVYLSNFNHEMVHRFYEMYKKDPTVLDRFKYLMDKMVEINDGKTFNQF